MASETSDGLPAQAKKMEEKQLWLTAFKDHLANIRAYSACVETADLAGTGDFQLVIADAGKKLRLYSGTQQTSDGVLLDVPVAICSFYADYSGELRKPLLAVASGPFIFIYKNLRPYYKFVLPAMELLPQEVSVWEDVANGKLPRQKAFEALEALRDAGNYLSNRTMDLLNMDNPSERDAFFQRVEQFPLSQHTVITCMSTLNKDRDEPGAVACLVVGTEDAKLCILEKTGDAIKKKIQLPAVPVQLLTSGLVDVDYRIVVMCRNGNIYIIKNGELTGVVLEIEAQPVAMVRVENQIVVATTTNHVHFYTLKGAKQATLTMPAPITNICALVQENLKQPKAFLVALANGEVRTYVGRCLLNRMQVFGVVTAMKVAKYGREESSLIVVLQSGSLIISMLPRRAQISATKSAEQGPPPEQDIPLNVPKRTNLYVELTKREKDSAVDMHRVFQRDLCKLRLQTARAYVKILTDGVGTQSYVASASVRLTAQVTGLGPQFKIKLTVQNTGSKALANVPVVFTYNLDIYRLARPHLLFPNLVPAVVYNYEVAGTCVAEGDAAVADTIHVYVCNPTSAVPVITALVKMPQLGNADMLLGA